MQAVNDLLEKVSDKELNEYSLNNLQNKELAEVLSAYLGKEIKPEEVQTELDKMSEEELEELNEEKEEKENSLTDKQAEKVKVNGIQKVDLNTKADGKRKFSTKT